MTGKRIRLDDDDDDERLYVIALVEADNKMRGRLIGHPVSKLLQKLGNDKSQPAMKRDIPTSYFVCSELGCDKVVKTGAGITRHTATQHLREPTAEEKRRSFR